MPAKPAGAGAVLRVWARTEGDESGPSASDGTRQSLSAAQFGGRSAPVRVLTPDGTSR